MMNGQNQAQPVDPAFAVTITLPVKAWQNILDMIGKAPWEQANPIIGELIKQINAGLAQHPTADNPNRHIGLA